jgi:mono/diheme cytochrome c family protein
MLKKARFMSFLSVLFSAATLSLACGALWRSSTNADSTSDKKGVALRQWTIVKVELPAVDESFPPGSGADIANSQCLICHSAGMVLTQPPLKKEEWRAEVMKMRSAYGAPIPEDQVDGLSEYLKNINDDNGT